MSRGRLLSRFPVFGIRDFRLLLADRLIAPASVGFSIVGVSFAVLKTTNSATDLSYVLAAQIAPALVFALSGGARSPDLRSRWRWSCRWRRCASRRSAWACSSR